ncbi:MAG: flippase-like domain-containing protein [Candidatus Omnitrophica bacterium]|nr:flippase-like domain-containing protein [Candidatus Omnitrophota bacterium]
MLKKFNRLFLRLGVSILSLALVYYSVRGEIVEGITHLKNVLVLPVAAALFINFISLFFVTLRIDKILTVQHIRLSLSRLYYLWCVSLFFNLFLPSAIGGDIAKAYYIYKDSGKKMASITSVFIDRFFGLIATISIASFAFLLGHKHIEDPRIGQSLFWIGGFAFVGAFFFISKRFSIKINAFVLKLSPKHFHEKLRKFFEALELYRQNRIDFFMVYFYSLMALAMFVVIVFLLALSIHIQLPITIFFLFMPLILVISMVPSIGGLGVREAATVYLFKPYIAADQAVALALIFDLFIYGIGFVCGILYAIRGGASIREMERIEN